ncbi:hypothetical protein J2I47_05065 [Fibrella sp. HMF5335]|uniref:Uncharacterized protein n=1 Tax=Fibrella rubiginis TaxID=2817060 RepID=A0A939GCP1_9BACT|nr:hypothetical protein [Fibrella rubiginis]MBO0935911.1 hypothetical protein [Fibrella rubiginis]
MHPLHTAPCDDSLGNPASLEAMLAEDKAGYMPGHTPDPFILARHNGLMKATKDFKKAITKFTVQGPMVKRTARPIFITKAMLKQLVYEHDGTHGLQLYWGFVPQLNGVDAAWDPISNKKPWPTLDFRLLIVPTKYGAAFDHDNPSPEQRACHITLTPSKIYAPKTNQPNAPYVWQDATLGDRQDLKASQVHMWPFDPDTDRPKSYFIGRYRLYNDLLQNHAMIRIEPMVFTSPDATGRSVTQVGLVMAGVDRESDPWPAWSKAPDEPGDGPKPTIYWTKYIDTVTGAYCTLPCRPHCPGGEGN